MEAIRNVVPYKGTQEVRIINLVKKINENKVISIIRSDLMNLGNIGEIFNSLYKANIDVVEITLNSKNALECIQYAKDNYENMIIGAGTVKNLNDAKKAKEAGAKFILMPNLDIEVIKYGKENDILVIPGAFTPSEVYQAYEAGAEIIKIFPIVTLGEDYLGNIFGPLGRLNIMGVGGINSNNARKYLDAGCSSLGIGSSIVNDKLIAEGRYDLIEENAKNIMANMLEEDE